jgi:DNA-binding winged helix-turn-helix (wHTH) protein/tetratricopeptide (TPR) repeat protein
MRDPKPLNRNEVYRFGDFRFNVSERTLECDGKPLSLSPKAWDVLKVLISHRGRLVDKQTLMAEVWPGTFVEENNLAFNISILRKVLGENAATPKFIETVPKRGYRFVAPVEEAFCEPALVPHAGDSLPTNDEITHITAAVPSVPSLKWSRKLLAAGVIGVASLVTLVSVRYANHPKLNGEDTILLAGFTNDTGEHVFDGALDRGLAIELEQSPFLSLIPERRVRQILSLMDQPPGAQRSPDANRDLCRRAGGAAVMQGKISRLGSEYVVSLQATTCTDGRTMYEGQAEASKKEQVLTAVSRLAGEFRRKAGDSRENLQRYGTPLSEATTPSPEALEAYTLGWRQLAISGAAAALPHFHRAIELDSKFAMAYAALGRIYADLDQSSAAMENTKRAWELRERTSDQEKFLIKANYDLFVTGNLLEARQTAELWSQTYPRLSQPHFMLSGIPNKVSGNFITAMAEAKKGLALDPEFGIGYYNLAVNNAYLNRFEEAQQALQQASVRGVEDDEVVMLRFELAFLRGDDLEMSRQATRARRRSGSATWMSFRQASVLFYAGRAREARGILSRAITEAEMGSQHERAALWQASAAVREAWLGNVSQATLAARAAMHSVPSRDVQYAAALVFGLAGDVASTQEIAARLEREYPVDTCVQFSYLPVLRARLALNKGDAPSAIEALQVAAPYEDGITESVASGLFGAMYPVYLRGEAYLAEKQGKKAAFEFQRILAHSGIVVADPVGALARLQLARAWSMESDSKKAQSAYRDLLSLWKDADPNIPVLLQAKAEYQKLK